MILEILAFSLTSSFSKMNDFIKCSLLQVVLINIKDLYAICMANLFESLKLVNGVLTMYITILCNVYGLFGNMNIHISSGIIFCCTIPLPL